MSVDQYMSERKSPSYLGKALLIEVRPIPMALAILAALFGASVGFLITGSKYPVLIIHVANVFCILYLAHLVDTYNDLKRGEYEHGYQPRFLFDQHDPERVVTLNPKNYLYAMILDLPVIAMLSGILIVETGYPYLLLAFSGLFFAVAYGSGLDRVFLVGDLAWEMGVVLAFLGGFYVVTHMVTGDIIVMTVTLVPLLLGIKILDAEPDIEVDRNSVPRKNTIPVKLGVKWAHRVAYMLMVPPLLLLLKMVPNLHPILVYPLILLIGLVAYSYPMPATKGLYPISAGIILFLVTAIATLNYMVL